MSAEPIHSRGLGRSGPKRKTGCLTCRRRKVRCDERKPICSNCIRLRLDCVFGDRPMSRAGSAPSTSPEQPSSKDIIGPPAPPPFVQQPYDPSINAAIPLLAPQPLVAPTNWPNGQMDHGWRFDVDVSSTFANPFQDIFLSSIDTFDPNYDNSYTSDPWPQSSAAAHSEIATDPNSVQHPAASTATTTATTTTTTTEASVEPPHRDEERSRKLVDHFVQSPNPISIILPTDLEWDSACRSLLAMAKQCEPVLSAICALSALHLFTTNQHDTLQEAFQHYHDASQQVDSLLDDLELDSKRLKGAFATLFLLTRVELMAQSNSDAKAYGWPLQHLQNAHHRVHQHSDQIQQWRGISKRLLTWTTLLQTKAEYNAGITALENSSEPLTNSIGDPFARQGISGKGRRSPAGRQHQNGHADAEDDTRTIFELAYDTMNQPAFDFFLRSQAFTSRIISLDAYHRQRGTVQTEFEILNDGRQISADLHALWDARPGTVTFLDDPAALEEVLQPALARKVLLNIRVYVANYFAQFIYLHRVAYRAYPATEDVETAVAKIVSLARTIEQDDLYRRRNLQHHNYHNQATLPRPSSLRHRQTHPQQSTYLHPLPSTSPDAPTSDSTSGTPKTTTTSSSSTNFPPTTSTGHHAPPNPQHHPSSTEEIGLPASMLWPLFLAAIEGNKDERNWVLGLVQRMDPQTVPNAAKTALLLEEVLRRQEVGGVRVDHRTVRKDLFDGELSVLY